MQRRFTGSSPKTSLVGGTVTGVELGADVAPDDAAVSFPGGSGEGEEG